MTTMEGMAKAGTRLTMRCRVGSEVKAQVGAQGRVERRERSVGADGVWNSRLTGPFISFLEDLLSSWRLEELTEDTMRSSLNSMGSTETATYDNRAFQKPYL